MASYFVAVGSASVVPWCFGRRFVFWGFLLGGAHSQAEDTSPRLSVWVRKESRSS